MRWKDGGWLEGGERNGRHHEFGSASWDRSRGTETKRAGCRTTRHSFYVQLYELKNYQFLSPFDVRHGTGTDREVREEVLVT